MHPVSIDEDGFPTVDRACVGCGQCAPTCLVDAHKLRLKGDVPELPIDLTEQFI